MSAETLPRPDLSQSLPEMTEYAAVPNTMGEPDLQSGHQYPAPYEHDAVADVMQPHSTEADIAQAVDMGSRNAFEAVKDLYYKAGAKYTVLTTMGEESTNPVQVNINALKRRKMVERGMGVLACAKLGLDVYKATKGMHAAVQTEFFQDVAQVDMPSDASGEPHYKELKVNPADVIDHTLEYSHQGLEGATNALITTQQNKRKSSRSKADNAA